MLVKLTRNQEGWTLRILGPTGEVVERFEVVDVEVVPDPVSQRAEVVYLEATAVELSEGARGPWARVRCAG